VAESPLYHRHVKTGQPAVVYFISDLDPRCWETDVLPGSVIERAIDANIRSWLDDRLWQLREAEIERARRLL